MEEEGGRIQGMEGYGKGRGKWKGEGRKSRKRRKPEKIAENRNFHQIFEFGGPVPN